MGSMANVKLLVISGPSGAGKSAVIKKLRQLRSEATLALSATTRAPRLGERDGADYRFVKAGDFDQLLKEGQLLEWAVVHGVHRYGTLKKDVEDKLAAGKLVILDVDLQGLKSLKKVYPDLTSVYLLPPSAEEWKRRLQTRGTEDIGDFQRRMATAEEERQELGLYSKTIVNDDLDRACAEILALVEGSAQA